MELLLYIFGPIVALLAVIGAFVPFLLAGGAAAAGRPGVAVVIGACAFLGLALLTPVDISQSSKSTFWPWPLAIAIFLGRVNYASWAKLFPWLAGVGAMALVIGFVGGRVIAWLWARLRRSSTHQPYVPPKTGSKLR